MQMKSTGKGTRNTVLSMLSPCPGPVRYGDTKIGLLSQDHPALKAFPSLQTSKESSGFLIALSEVEVIPV